jgi:hypothetical protein
MSKILPQSVVERRLAELANDREQVLAGYIPEAEAARRLKTSRQALFKRPPHFKREIGGARGPQGWVYRHDKLLAYISGEGNNPFGQGAAL